MAPTLRALVRRPLFSLTVVATLAVGLGLVLAVISLLVEIRFRPLPYRDADRLAVVWARNVERGWQVASASYVELRELAERTDALELVSPFLSDRDFVLTGAGASRTVETTFVDESYLPTLGATARAGRLFTAEEARPGSGARVVVVSEAFWRAGLGGRDDVVGSVLRLSGQPFTVVGVVAAGHRDVVERWHRAELYAPLAAAPLLYGDQIHATRTGREFNALARLRRGASWSIAEEQAARLASELAREFPVEHDGFDFRLMPLREFFYGDVEALGKALAAGAAFVLLIVAVNLAHLFLVRDEARRGELAVRAALGADAGRILRRGLGEALLLTAAGGVLALPLGALFLRPFRAEGALQLPVFTRLALGGWSVAALVVALAGCALLFALVPVARARRTDLRAALAVGARGSSDRPTSRRRQLFVVAEVALAVLLLAGANLMATSLRSLRGRELGLRTDRLLTASFGLDAARYPDRDTRVRFFERLLVELGDLPGAESVALWGPNPPGTAWYNVFATPSHLEPELPENQITLRRLHISPGALRALGVRLIEGREIAAGARPAGAPLEVVVSEKFARRFWPPGDAVGRTVFLGGTRELAGEIVGVASDVRQNGRLFDESSSPGDVYLSVLGRPPVLCSVVVRYAGEPGATLEALRERFARVDPDVPLGDVATLDRRLERETGRHDLAASLFAVYAALATLLAALGVYGVLAFATSQRTREYGVRMALGATPALVRRRLLGGAASWIGLGLALGAGGAIPLGLALRGLLVEVSPAEPGLLATSALPVLLVALAACAIPAWRASRTNPVVALRGD